MNTRESHFEENSLWPVKLWAFQEDLLIICIVKELLTL